MKKILLLSLSLLLSLQIFAQDDIEIINIENEAVRAYMKDSTYFKTSGGWNTVVYNYSKNTSYGKNLDWPAGKLVTWTTTLPANQLKDIVIMVSEDADYSNSLTYSPDNITDKSFTIRNLLPNKTYHYAVGEQPHDGEFKILTTGTFRTVGQVRMIQVRNAHNVRDIGGWNSLYGGTIKYGMLYRSGSLETMNAKGCHDFKENLNVHAELDLRSESRRKFSAFGEDADFLLLPTDAGTREMIKKNPTFPQELRWIIDRLKEGKAVDWHCALGCDRCGAVSFLIEGLLGLSEIDLCRDFELSSFKSGYNRPRSHLASMLKFIKTYAQGESLQKSFYTYWKSIGLTEEELDFLINHMVQLPEGYVVSGAELIAIGADNNK